MITSLGTLIFRGGRAHEMVKGATYIFIVHGTYYNAVRTCEHFFSNVSVRALGG